MQPNAKLLITDTVLKCLKHKISFKLIAKPHVIVNKIKCSGYFDEEDRELAVATNKKENDWLFILIHESCHLDQFLQKTPIWKNGEDGIGIIDEWLGGKAYKEKELLKALKDTILLEMDCEKRSVKKIKKYKIETDVSEYIQKANAYLLSYWATYRDKKWYPFPYNTPSIYKNMPTKFLSENDYLNKNHSLLNLYK
jgi:hypothetical protein